jgi:hypothetical protein
VQFPEMPLLVIALLWSIFKFLIKTFCLLKYCVWSSGRTVSPPKKKENTIFLFLVLRRFLSAYPNTILDGVCLSVTKFSKAHGNGPRVHKLGVFGIADYEYDIEIFRARFRKRWAWPKTMIWFISSKFVIFGGNRVRGARNVHQAFPHARPEAESEINVYFRFSMSWS